jgi:hypothetical protein
MYIKFNKFKNRKTMSKKIKKAEATLRGYFTTDANGNKIFKPFLYGGIPASTGFRQTNSDRKKIS